MYAQLCSSFIPSVLAGLAGLLMSKSHGPASANTVRNDDIGV